MAGRLQGRREERRREQRRKQRREQRRVEEEREAESIIFGSGEWAVKSKKQKVESSIWTPRFSLSTFYFPLSTPTPHQRGNDHVRREKQRLSPRRPERPRRNRRGPSGAQHKPPRARP